MGRAGRQSREGAEDQGDRPAEEGPQLGGQSAGHAGAPAGPAGQAPGHSQDIAGQEEVTEPGRPLAQAEYPEPEQLRDAPGCEVVCGSQEPGRGHRDRNLPQVRLAEQNHKLATQQSRQQPTPYDPQEHQQVVTAIVTIPDQEIRGWQ